MQITAAEDIKKLGTILSIWAHPDDESFLAGGLLRAAVLNGQRVVCVTATKGEAGVQDETRWPPETLAETRALELQQALVLLGIHKNYWLEGKDGHCDEMPGQAMAEKLAKIIELENPDTIVTFGSDGWTGHPDHRAVSHWVTDGVRSSGHHIAIYHVTCSPEHYQKDLQKIDELFDVFFNTDTPPLTPLKECDIHFEMSPEILRTKLAAYKAMASQTEIMFTALGEDTLSKGLCCETFVKARS